MDYDFSRQECEKSRVILALTLDQKKMTERIVIAQSDEARLRLEQGYGDVYFDETRPLGSLLIHFGGDRSREWNTHGMILRESYGKVFPFETERWKAAMPVARQCGHEIKNVVE